MVEPDLATTLEPETSSVPMAWNIALWVLTFACLLSAGALHESGATLGDLARAPHLLLQGLVYALCVFGLLCAQHLVRHVVARLHRVPVSLPFFVPAATLVGSFGAITYVEDPRASRNARFDVALIPAFAMALLALGCLVFGVWRSEPIDIESLGLPQLSEPPLIRFLTKKFHPEAIDVGIRWHPLALAGWHGLVLIMFQLVPFGFTDGAAIARGLMGPAQRFLGAGVIVLAIIAGAIFRSAVWIVWPVIVVLLGTPHFEDDARRLDFKAWRLSLLVILLAIVATVFTMHPTGFGLSPS